VVVGVLELGLLGKSRGRGTLNHGSARHWSRTRPHSVRCSSSWLCPVDEQRRAAQDGEWRERSGGLREKGRKYLGFDAQRPQRIRAALAAHAGRRSPTMYGHHLWCRARGAFDRCVRLSGGSD
jgi:hypothetical protein